MNRRNWFSGLWDYFGGDRIPQLVLIILSLLVLILVSQSSRAFSLFGGGGGLGGIVYDPTNFVQTSISAGEAVKQTALQVQAEIQRLQQLSAALQQLKTLPQEVIQQTLKDSLQQITVLQQGSALMASISTEVDGIKQLYSSRLRQMAALGLSPSDYLQYEIQLAQLQNKNQSVLMDQDQQVLAGVQKSMDRLQSLQAQIPASSGVQQSMQTTNQYLDLLAGQSIQLIQLTASQAAANTNRQQLQDSNAADAVMRETARIKSDNAKIRVLRQQLRDNEAKNGWGIMQPLPSASQ
jgi:P-type conjugative transfer protein TrbJ